MKLSEVLIQLEKDVKAAGSTHVAIQMLDSEGNPVITTKLETPSFQKILQMAYSKLKQP